MRIFFDGEYILQPVSEGHTLFFGAQGKRCVEYVIATAIEGMGLLECPWATRLNSMPHLESYELRKQLQQLAANQTLRDRLYYKAALGALKRPQATWDVEYSPHSKSIQLIFLG